MAEFEFDLRKFPENLAESALNGLSIAFIYIPSSEEVVNAEKGSPSDRTRIEKQYGEAADAFAMILDPVFDPRKQIGSVAEIRQLRADFYQMVRWVKRSEIRKYLDELNR